MTVSPAPGVLVDHYTPPKENEGMFHLTTVFVRILMRIQTGGQATLSNAFQCA